MLAKAPRGVYQKRTQCTLVHWGHLVWEGCRSTVFAVAGGGYAPKLRACLIQGKKGLVRKLLEEKCRLWQW